jgi:hypothetical protein
MRDNEREVSLGAFTMLLLLWESKSPRPKAEGASNVLLVGKLLIDRNSKTLTYQTIRPGFNVN